MWKGKKAMGADRAPHDALLVQFLGTLLQRTVDCPTVEAHHQALQSFLDALPPWISPADFPTLLRQPFTLFDHLAFTPPRRRRRGRLGGAVAGRGGRALPRLAPPAGAGSP